MVGSIEFIVVDEPFSWHAVSEMPIPALELPAPFVSCGEIGAVRRSKVLNGLYFTATWKGRAALAKHC